MEDKKFLAYLFSFIPGGGHLYLGFQKRGLQLMGCFFIVAFIHNTINIHFFDFLIPLVWFYSIFDINTILSSGYSDNPPVNSDTIKFDSNFSKIIAFGFMIIGLCYLFTNVVFPVFDIHIDYKIQIYIRKGIASLLLIFIGLNFLKASKNFLFPHKKENLK